MGDSDDGALESIECRLEMLPPLNVEVIQRLVQQEHIAASQHQQRELQTTALAERASPDCPEDAVTTEQEEVQAMARLGLTHTASVLHVGAEA